MERSTSSDLSEIELDVSSNRSFSVNSVKELEHDERLLWRCDSWRDGAVKGTSKAMLPQDRQSKLEGAFRTILECIGEDPDRDGLVETPLRAAKSILFLTKGYEENVEKVVKNAKFEEDYNEIVMVKDIEFHSLCEHHLIPFYGKMCVGYIPRNKVLGLSKIARIADMFSRRLQTQERLTKQIAHAMVDAIGPSGVGIIIEGTHMCMCMRGVEKSGASTITSMMLGTFLDDPRTRDEFLRMART